MVEMNRRVEWLSDRADTVTVTALGRAVTSPKVTKLNHWLSREQCVFEMDRGDGCFVLQCLE
jgi:hypothetical protein